MKYKPFLCFIIVASILVSCGYKNEVISYKKFLSEMPLSLTQIELDETVFMRYPFKIVKSDSLIFILDLHPLEHFVQCYSYPDFKHRFSLFKRGEGPEEHIQIDNIQ